MEQLTGSGLRKEYKAVYCHPVYLTYMQSTSRGLEESQVGNQDCQERKKKKIAGRNINNLRYVDGITLMAESEEELKSLLMRVKEESEKSGLKLNIKKTKVMASSPITSWQIEGEKVEAGTDFLFLGCKITVDCDYSHEIRWSLLLGRKAVTKLDSMLKSRDISLPTKVRMVKAFPVVTYSCESWTIKKAEHWGIDAFELWCWRRRESLAQQGDQTSQS